MARKQAMMRLVDAFSPAAYTCPAGILYCSGFTRWPVEVVRARPWPSTS
ncbi:hypothetical protein [Saccharopolyspora sp. ASAGF58]|nr:hypothetical protein [Saccharopolyspora sp. ASAGF58]